MKTISTLLVFLTIALIGPRADARPFRYVTHPKGLVDYWPRWSPDGQTILFSRCVITTGCAGGAVEGIWNLFTVPAGGGPATQFLQITDVSATRSNWLWNSNVDMPIAFSGVKSGPSGESGVYLVAADGSNPTRMPTDDSIPNGYPSWFPDGSALTVEGMFMMSEPFIDLIRRAGWDTARDPDLHRSDLDWTVCNLARREYACVRRPDPRGGQPVQRRS